MPRDHDLTSYHGIILEEESLIRFGLSGRTRNCWMRMCAKRSYEYNSSPCDRAKDKKVRLPKGRALHGSLSKAYTNQYPWS